MYYFYVLKLVDGSYYYGSTDNLKRRYSEHKNGKVFSTKNKLPPDLQYYEAYRLLKLARSREKQVKNSGSVRKALHKRILQEPGQPGHPAGSKPSDHTFGLNGPARPPKGQPGQ